MNARRVIHHVLDPHFVNETSFYDMASIAASFAVPRLLN